MTGPVPAMFDHCATIYAAMEADSKLEPAADGEIRVYEGFLTGLFATNSISIPYYTSVMKALRKMGCVEQLRRGGGPAPSRWALFFEPTEEGYMAAIDNIGDSPRGGAIAVVEQRNRDLVKRVDELETRLAAVEAYLERAA